MVSAWVKEAAQRSDVKEEKFKAAIVSVYARPQLKNLPCCSWDSVIASLCAESGGGVVSIKIIQSSGCWSHDHLLSSSMRTLIEGCSLQRRNY